MSMPRARAAALAALLAVAVPARGAVPESVGEKRQGQNADEVALRDQAALLRGGSVTLELAGSYARGERDFGTVLLEQRAASAEVAVRVGLADGLQLSARLPWRYREAMASAPGDPATPAVRRTRQGLGDVALGLFAVLLREGVGRPNLVLSLEGLAPSGPGDAGAGAGLAVTRSYDPVVLFAGAAWMYGLSIDPSSDDRVLARHNVTFQIGQAFAVNESVALAARVIGSFRGYGASATGFRPPREQYRLQLGATWLLGRRVFLEPTATFAVGSAAPDVVFGLSLVASP